MNGSQTVHDDDPDDDEYNQSFGQIIPDDVTNGCIGTLLLIGIPRQSIISLDGAVRTVGREDVGIVGLQPNLFHLFSCRPCVDCKGVQSSGLNHSLAVGIVIMVMTEDVSNNNNWIVARKYDAKIEELSSDEVYTSCNTLEDIINSGALSLHHFCRYQEFLAMPPAMQQSNTNVADSWFQLVSYITPSLLRRRGIRHGDKIIPGSFQNDDRVLENSGQKNSKQVAKDGLVITYPPIPCIDDDASADVKRMSHVGTKNFLKTLSPSDRTLLLHHHQSTAGMVKSTFTSVEGAVLESVLHSSYSGKWEDLIGDLQLSFVAFLYLGCLASFEHWRDLVSMLSLAGEEQVSRRPGLFSALLNLLTCHLRSIEIDFFEEVDISSGNFFLPAMQKLFETCTRHLEKKNSDIIRQPLQYLMDAMKQRFGLCFESNCEKKRYFPTADLVNDCDSSDDYKNTILQLSSSKIGEGTNKRSLPEYSSVNFAQLSREDLEDEDGPVIVQSKEIEDSFARSSLLSRNRHILIHEDVRDRDLEQTYPLLFAAKASNPHDDIVMTCARILESASDVSLVREAASYLEQVENSKV